MPQYPHPLKLLPRQQLARLSRSMRDDGRVLVLTNGCFDLLHVGHVRYLRAARGFGDALAVGVNADAAVTSLKGPTRPLTPAAERAEILSALEFVDYVVIFDEDTAVELVREIRPAVYVKGGDYSPDPLAPNYPIEGHAVREYGGTVEIVGYVPGHSTTEVMARLGART